MNNYSNFGIYHSPRFFDWSTLYMSGAVWIDRNIQSTTYNWAQRSYFRFASAILETDYNQLGQSQTVRIHPGNTSDTIRKTTSGLLSPRMIVSGIDCSSVAHRGGSRPDVVFQSGTWCAKRSEPTGQFKAIKQSPKNHIRHTRNRSVKPLPVCLKSTAVASSSQNTASKLVQIVGIHYCYTVNMHLWPFRIVRKSPVGEVNFFQFWPNLINLVDEHVGGLFEFCSFLALGRTVSEIWGDNFVMRFRGGNFAPKIKPRGLHMTPCLLPMAISSHVFTKYLKINPFGLLASIKKWL